MPDGTRTDRGKNSGIPTKGELYLGVSRKDFTGFLERVRDNQVILEFHVPRIRSGKGALIGLDSHVVIGYKRAPLVQLNAKWYRKTDIEHYVHENA
ncbi:hypothetical protein SLS56_007507 [Neofusicoccum ribis]|uniref:Uncharacterized protein n=1 Tax=Neofusicoccum ribis TaxID=45134 RepID=A0ABR3SMQ0_9PEZI